MIDREQYTPGPASGAQVRKDGEKWTLILVRELRHSPEKVWQALTDPAHLREWAPFEADGSLGTVGPTVKLTTVGAPTPQVSESGFRGQRFSQQAALKVSCRLSISAEERRATADAFFGSSAEINSSSAQIWLQMAFDALCDPYPDLSVPLRRETYAGE